MECYKGQQGALTYIADLADDYDGEKTIEGLKGLIDEIKEEALKALKLKEDYKPLGF